MPPLNEILQSTARRAANGRKHFRKMSERVPKFKSLNLACQGIRRQRCRSKPQSALVGPGNSASMILTCGPYRNVSVANAKISMPGTALCSVPTRLPQPQNFGIAGWHRHAPTAILRGDDRQAGSQRPPPVR
jgi:hypothetical protein